MKTTRYVRRPFAVDAVEVTEENFEEVAAWCGGAKAVRTPAGRHIDVPVEKPRSPRQTMAFVGDYVLRAKTGFKVFTKRAFEEAFMLAPQPRTLPAPRSDRGKGRNLNGFNLVDETKVDQDGDLFTRRRSVESP